MPEFPPPAIDPIRSTDDEARALARALVGKARFGSLGTIDPETGHPQVTRVALGIGPGGGLYTLVSGLSAHSRALRADPRVGLLIGEPGAKGDPLTHPRLSLSARARSVSPDTAEDAGLRARWLADHPKAKLYIDLPDFFFVEFVPLGALLNGGFARAFRLTPDDLRL